MPEINDLKEEDQSVLAPAYSPVWKAEPGVQGQPELHRGFLSKEKGKAEGRMKKGGREEEEDSLYYRNCWKGREHHLSFCSCPFLSLSLPHLAFPFSLPLLFNLCSLAQNLFLPLAPMLSVETTQRVYLGSRFPADQSASRISSSLPVLQNPLFPLFH